MPAAATKLTRGGQFRAVLQGNGRYAGRNFVVRSLPNALSYPRLGLIAARKVARRAVDRNRGKRLAREAFRGAQKALPALDIVIQLRTDLRKNGNASLRQELNMLLARCISP